MQTGQAHRRHRERTRPRLLAAAFALLLAGALLFGAAPASAADGDECSDTEFSAVGGSVGMAAVWCVVLCDDATGNGACADYNIDDDGPGLPHLLSFEIGLNDCSAGTATFQTKHTPNTTEHDLESSTAVSIGGTTRLMVDQRRAPVSEIITTTLSGLSGCTAGIDILLVGYVQSD